MFCSNIITFDFLLFWVQLIPLLYSPYGLQHFHYYSFYKSMCCINWYLPHRVDQKQYIKAEHEELVECHVWNNWYQLITTPLNLAFRPSPLSGFIRVRYAIGGGKPHLLSTELSTCFKCWLVGRRRGRRGGGDIGSWVIVWVGAHLVCFRKKLE